MTSKQAHDIRCPKCNRLLMKVAFSSVTDLEINTVCPKSSCGALVTWPILVAGTREAAPKNGRVEVQAAE